MRDRKTTSDDINSAVCVELTRPLLHLHATRTMPERRHPPMLPVVNNSKWISSEDCIYLMNSRKIANSPVFPDKIMIISGALTP